jgi:hypothetical protein
MKEHDKSHRRDAGQYSTAAELCRRRIVAVITMGNCPNTDILCSNKEGSRFVHIQVKTFVPGNKTCSVGMKAEHDYGDNFFWVLAGILTPDQKGSNIFYIIPSKEMAKNVTEMHKNWEKTPGKKGQKHNLSKVRTVTLPPRTDPYIGWDVSIYQDRWDLIEEKLKSQ